MNKYFIFILLIKINLLIGNDLDSIRKSNFEIYNIIFKDSIKPTYEAFDYGIKGYEQILKQGKLEKFNILTLIDYTQSSNSKRLWVIDMEKDSILFNSMVAHGKNSGEVFPTKFSNDPQTKMSSLGFFITGESYYGRHGLSLMLEGIEKGINDNAKKRAIVIHSANYVTTDFIRKYGRIGRSYGCPALPPAKNQPIIDAIKNKSCLFIYYPDKDYIKKSIYMNYKV